MVSVVLRNGFERSVCVPAGKGSSGWVNVAHVLRRSFCDPVKAIVSPLKHFQADFPPLGGKAVSHELGEISTKSMGGLEVSCRNLEWLIKIGSANPIGVEEVWNRVVLCVRRRSVVRWNEIALGAEWFLCLEINLLWIPVDGDRTIFICRSVEDGHRLCKWGMDLVSRDEFVFSF